MSHNENPFDYDEPWSSDALDLSIETLTGTTFEIRVDPEDKIMSIKAKIQRVEGIPLSQQHLLYNLTELNNSCTVKDYSIPNGAVLKLILSMRGGPISTRRLPPADEALWREVQEWMSEGRRDDPGDQPSSSSKTSFVVFRDGTSVNLYRVVENGDGTYSPLSCSPVASSSSLKDLLGKDELKNDPHGFGKRMMENWVTMGKMQEIKGKLEKLSISKKDKKPEDEADPENLDIPPPNTKNKLSWDEDAPCSSLASPPREAASLARMKARKDAENIIRLQAKSLNVIIDGHQFASLKRTPLPEIRRSPRPDRVEENKSEEENELRVKTGSRLPTSAFAILEEESDLNSAPSICSSASSLVALPSNDDVVMGYSSMSRGSASVGSRSFRLSRFVLNDRPKTAPNQPDQSKTEIPDYLTRSDNRNQVEICSTMELAPTWYRSKPRIEMPDTHVQSRSPRVLEELRVVTRPERQTIFPLCSPSSPKLPAPTTKPRCMVCKKKLNITNTHTCRCNGVFCSTHRYSETHDCHFDYKEEGKQLLRLSNPLVTASKLPKI